MSGVKGRYRTRIPGSAEVGNELSIPGERRSYQDIWGPIFEGQRCVGDGCSRTWEMDWAWKMIFIPSHYSDRNEKEIGCL
jgi:hypothetical protein